MAVIYMPQDPRWQAVQAVGQGLGQAFEQYAKQKTDQAVLAGVAQSLGEGQTPGQGQPAPDAGTTPPGGTIAPEVQAPPDFTKAELLASHASPQAQKIIQQMIDAKRWQWQQTQQGNRFQLNYAQKAAGQAETAAHHKATEQQGEQRLGIEQQGLKLRAAQVGIEGERLNMEQRKFPLMMQNLSTSVEKNKLQMDQLKTEQSTVWTPDEIHQAVESWVASGFKQTPNFGWARGASAVNRNNFWKEALSAQSMTPEQRREAVTQFHMQQTEAQTASRQLANLDININKADSLMKPIDASLAQLKPILSKSPMFNRFKKAILTGVGDPAFSGADVYIQSFLLTYAKALNPTGQATVDLHKTTQQFLDSVSSYPQLVAKLKALRTDMTLERSAVETGRGQILKQWDGGLMNPKNQPSSGTSTQGPPQAAIDYLKAHPDLKSQFDQKYGSGAADRAMGQ